MNLLLNVSGEGGGGGGFDWRPFARTYQMSFFSHQMQISQAPGQYRGGFLCASIRLFREEWL